MLDSRSMVAEIQLLKTTMACIGLNFYLKSIFKCGTILIDVLEVHLRKPVYVMSYLKIRYCLECSKLLTGLKLATYITKDI